MDSVRLTSKNKWWIFVWSLGRWWLSMVASGGFWQTCNISCSIQFDKLFRFYSINCRRVRARSRWKKRQINSHLSNYPKERANRNKIYGTKFDGIFLSARTYAKFDAKQCMGKECTAKTQWFVIPARGFHNKLLAIKVEILMRLYSMELHYKLYVSEAFQSKLIWCTFCLNITHSRTHTHPHISNDLSRPFHFFFFSCKIPV